MSSDLSNFLLIASGAALLLFGWALYWVALYASGALLLGAAGAAVGALVASLSGSEPEAAMAAAVIGGLTGAAAGALLFRFMHALAFFTVGGVAGVAGFLAVLSLARDMGLEWAMGDVAPAFGAPLAFVVAGLVAAALDDLLLAFAAAAAGTVLIMIGLEMPLGGLPALAIFPAGLAFQLWLTRSRRHRVRDEEAEA